MPRYIPAFALLAALWVGSAHADDMMMDGHRADGVYYGAISALIRSDLDFAGDLDAHDTIGSGYMLTAGYRFDDWLSAELAYTRNDDYETRNGSKNEKFDAELWEIAGLVSYCLLYTSPSPRDATLSRMPSSA